MQTILTVVHLFLAIGLIALVLMQHGKGADAGAAFGSGSSGTVFGASGAGNFLSRSTAILATLFFVTSIALGYFSMQKDTGGADIMQGLQQKTKAIPGQKLDLPQVQLEPVAAGEAPKVQETTKPTDMPPIDMSEHKAETEAPAVSDIPQPKEPQASTNAKAASEADEAVEIPNREPASAPLEEAPKAEDNAAALSGSPAENQVETQAAPVEASENKPALQPEAATEPLSETQAPAADAATQLNKE